MELMYTSFSTIYLAMDLSLQLVKPGMNVYNQLAATPTMEQLAFLSEIALSHVYHQIMATSHNHRLLLQ